MAIDKDLILKLRNLSQSGFSDCKKALDENNNDLEAAIKWLRSKGIAKASGKNALKEAKEGHTWVKKSDDGVSIIELNSETDFTANSSEFLALAERIAECIISTKTDDLEVIKNTPMSYNGETVENNCLHLSSVVGEKIVLSRVKYFSISENESASCYRHNNGKMSTVIVFNKKLDSKDIDGFAVHCAANNPKFIRSEEVDKNWIESEKEIIKSLLEKEGKPKEFHEKIVTERIKKIVEQNVLLEQPYFYENNKKVKEKLLELDADIKCAVYFGLGESTVC